MKYKYAAVVVWFQPDDNTIKNIQSYCSEVEKVFIIDNSNFLNEELARTVAGSDKYIYINLNGNKGLAYALNYGCSKAIENKYDYIFTMDQDSRFHKDGAKKMIQFIENSDEHIAMVVPNVVSIHIDNNGSLEYKGPDRNIPQYSLCTWAMTSGSLMNLSIYQKVGKFDDDLFIEHIDIDLGYKLNKKSYKIIRVRDSLILQRLGNSQKHRFIFWEIHPLYDNPVRTYYLIRNYIYLLKKYGIRYMKFSNMSIIKLTIKVLLYESQKKERIKMAVLGVKDGIQNNMKKYIEKVKT